MSDDEKNAKRAAYLSWLESAWSRPEEPDRHMVWSAGWLAGRDYARRPDPVREALVAALDEIRRLSLTIVGASEAYGETESAHLWQEVADKAEAALWPHAAPVAAELQPLDADVASED